MERVAPRLRRVVVQLGMTHVPDRVRAGDGRRYIGTDDDRGDRGVGNTCARERDRLACLVADGSAVVIDQHKNRVGHANPSS